MTQVNVRSHKIPAVGGKHRGKRHIGKSHRGKRHTRKSHKKKGDKRWQKGM
jgi:hypothetical protein